MFWHFSVLHRQKKAAMQRGFGLIELMVSISIMSIVMAVILVRQSSFNSAVLLRSQAYEIALSLRTVQLSAVSASNEAGDFREVLGVHFNKTPGNNGLFRIFRDTNNNNYYNTGEDFGLQGKLDDRFEIREIYNSNRTVTYPEISVIFERPNFDARFYTSANTVAGSSVIQVDVARRGAGTVCGADFRTVEVSSTGQITVKDCP